MLVEFVGGLVVKALNSCSFDGAVYALGLAVGPQVRWFGQAMLLTVFAADAVKAVPTGQE